MFQFPLFNDIVEQSRREIVEAGFEELRTPEEVDAAFKRPGTTLVMINSVCGCAGALLVLQRHTRFIMTNVQTIL